MIRTFALQSPALHLHLIWIFLDGVGVYFSRAREFLGCSKIGLVVPLESDTMETACQKQNYVVKVRVTHQQSTSCGVLGVEWEGWSRQRSQLEVPLGKACL